jgi:hypothetical protein
MKNETYSRQSSNSLSIIGVILLLVPISIWLLWISIFSSNPSASQAEKVQIFNSYFPLFLRSNSSISLVVLALSVGSIVFTILGQKSANRVFKTGGIFVIIIASVVLLLQTFSML